jgi:hypothetical protein
MGMVSSLCASFGRSARQTALANATNGCQYLG